MIPKQRGQWRTILYPGLFCPGYYIAKTGEQDRDGPSSLQGSEYMICFILRADIIQPDYKISFKRRVNNVKICLWLKHRKVNIEGFQQPRITRNNTSFNLFIHFYVDRSYQFDWFKQRLFSLEYKACLLRGLANSSDTRRVTGAEAQGHMRWRKENKIINNWINLNIQFCISPRTIDSHLHQPLDNGCKK